MQWFAWTSLLGVAILCGDEAVDLAQGNFAGEWRAASGASGKVTAQIIGRGRDDYEAIFTSERDGASHDTRLPLKGKREGDKLTFSGTLDLGSESGGTYEWTATAHAGQFKLEAKSPEESFTVDLGRVELGSPTLGAKPPAGAVVLFDGTNLDQWTTRDGQPAHWIVKDGAMEVGRSPNAKTLRGDIVSKPKFTDAKIHVEFKTPYMPVFRGQLRGNSGVYLQGRYEVQVLDSFGLPPRDNEAGGIYQLAAPTVNASLPPGEWQTYDIDFRAPRLNDKGEIIEPGRISVVHNGKSIHDGREFKNITPGGVPGNQAEPGPLLLQDHGNPVQYRNIWFVPAGG